MSSRKTKKIIKEEYHEAICWSCANKEFHNIDKSRMQGITIHKGVCPRCGNTATLIPYRDFEYATGLTNIWD